MSKIDNETRVRKIAGGDEFISTVSGLSTEQLKSRITSLQTELRESEDHKEENEQLKNARQLVSELSGPYRDVQKAVKLKTSYLIDLIRERGGQ